MKNIFAWIARGSRERTDSSESQEGTPRQPEIIASPGMMRLASPTVRIKRLYEDASLFTRQEKRAESDRVVAHLLVTGALTSGALSRAKNLWRATGRKESLWRVLLRSDEISEDTVFAAAAAAYGFQPVEVSLLETVGLMDHLARDWPKTVIPRLIGLGILPVVPSEGRRRKGVATFAAYDPTRPEVRRMVETVATGTHSVRYLSRDGIEECIRAVSDFLPDVMPQTIRSLGKAKLVHATPDKKAA